jgi:TIR domain
VNAGPREPGSAPAPKVFICYRREDTAAHAGRLYDAMVARFGERNVFMDVDLAPGVDFVERITEVVGACQALIVVMGPTWATVEDEEGRARIADPEDFVRLEVETALRRPDVTPIPVLVSGARMPKREDLPQEIGAITRRNALELSEARWRYDVDRLNSALDELLGEMTGTHRVEAPVKPVAVPPRVGRLPELPAQTRLLFEGILVAAVTAIAAKWVADLVFGKSDVATVGERVATWIPVAVALAIWLTLRRGDRTAMSRHVFLALAVGAVAAAISGVITVVLRSNDVSGDAREIPAFAVIGAGLGGLLGALWVPSRAAIGLVAGAAAGALVGLIITNDWSHVLGAGLRAVAITGLALTALLAVSARAERAVIKADVESTERPP